MFTASLWSNSHSAFHSKMSMLVHNSPVHLFIVQLVSTSNTVSHYWFCCSVMLSIIHWFKRISLSAPCCSMCAITLSVTGSPHLSIHQNQDAQWHQWVFACLSVIRREVLRLKPAASDLSSRMTRVWQLKPFSRSSHYHSVVSDEHKWDCSDL